MKIKLHSYVLLKDGRKGTIIHIYKCKTMFEIEINCGSEIIAIKLIEKILK